MGEQNPSPQLVLKGYDVQNFGAGLVVWCPCFHLSQQSHPFMQALELAKNKNSHMRDKSAVISWVQSARRVNQKEMVALGRLALEGNVFASAQALQLTLELMRMIIRLNLEPAFANEVEVLRDAFDNALVRSYTLWKAESTSPSEWWAAHRGIACLVTDVSRVDRSLAEATAWLPVADDLEVVIQGTRCSKSPPRMS